MKKFIFYFIIASLVFGETKKWDAHSAYLLPQKRWEMGLFQPFRYGYSESIEYSVHPLWFFVMPNLSIKKSQSDIAGFTSASQYKMVYPTPFLNMIAKKGTMGIIAPEFQMPPMVGLSVSWLMSKTIFPFAASPYSLIGLDLTLKGGLDLGVTFGDLDTRSTIDIPLVYHRLGVYYNKWSIHTGLDIQKNLTQKFTVLFDLDLKLLPGLAEVQIDPDASKLMGEYSLEHKLLLIWNKSENFRVLTGYKFVMGEYPYGSDMRLLPYIPMAETWVPIIEFQWARQKR